MSFKCNIFRLSTFVYTNDAFPNLFAIAPTAASSSIVLASSCVLDSVCHPHLYDDSFTSLIRIAAIAALQLFLMPFYMLRFFRANFTCCQFFQLRQFLFKLFVVFHRQWHLLNIVRQKKFNYSLASAAACETHVCVHFYCH